MQKLDKVIIFYCYIILDIESIILVATELFVTLKSFSMLIFQKLNENKTTTQICKLIKLL